MMTKVSELLEKQGYTIYPDSFRPIAGGAQIFVACRGGRKVVGLVQGRGAVRLSPPVLSASLESGRGGVSLHELTWEDYRTLKALIPISPSTCDKNASFGTGDRLGLVSAAHLSVQGRYPVFPVISQQSPRELVRTRRTFQSVLLDAVMGVLESGYTGRIGADADHIKDEQYLREGAQAGYSMYTLDVSDWLQDIGGLSDDEVWQRAETLSPLSRQVVSESAHRKFSVPKGDDYYVSELELVRSALIYEKSMEQVKHFNGVIEEYLSDFDLEVSIDEGSRDTTPEDHLFVAEYLHKSGIDFWSLAPKFPGEFQKGVDYMGDANALERSMRVHGALCSLLQGYRLSLHSGSDKFSIYPLFAEVTEGRFHVKTSGTSWLQAVKLVASVDLPLFKELYSLCLENLAESKKAYHVYITREHFPASLPDGDLPTFFDRRDVRQLFHISYGVLLDNSKAEIFDVLQKHEEEHYGYVGEHIERHLKLLFQC